MRRIFITGSSEGLGFLAGQILVEQGHRVVLHARNESKARGLKEEFPQCESIVTGDVSTIDEMKSVAEQANVLGQFDSIIHNVGIFTSENRVLTSDGITQTFAVNVVAPYVLTALIHPPQRLIYMSSGMHTLFSPSETASCQKLCFASGASRSIDQIFRAAHRHSASLN